MPLQLTTIKNRQSKLDLDLEFRTIKKAPEITISGSMLYEEIGTGELVLNFYTTSFD